MRESNKSGIVDALLNKSWDIFHTSEFILDHKSYWNRDNKKIKLLSVMLNLFTFSELASSVQYLYFLIQRSWNKFRMTKKLIYCKSFWTKWRISSFRLKIPRHSDGFWNRGFSFAFFPFNLVSLSPICPIATSPPELFRDLTFAIRPLNLNFL